MHVVIHAPTVAAKTKLLDDLNTIENAYEVVETADNTVKIKLDHNRDAALELLSTIVTAQPQYVGMVLNNPLAAALKRTAKILENRTDQIDAAISESVGTSFTAAQKWTPRRDPLTLDLDGDD